MKSIQRLSAVVLAAGFVAACDGGNGPAVGHQQLSGLSCPAGKIPWDYQRFAAGYTSESLGQLRAITGDDSLGSSNFVVIDDAVCGAQGFETNIIDVIGPLANLQKRQTVNPPSTSLVLSYASRCRYFTEPFVTYHCSTDPTNKKSVLFTKPITCSGNFVASMPVCVPENCYGRTRRDKFLECVPDLLKPVESKATLAVNIDVLQRPLQDPARTSTDAYQADANAVQTVTFDHGQQYRFKGSVDVTNTPAPRQLLTLWMKSTVPAPGSTTPTLDIFRCVVGRIDLSQYTPKELPGNVRRVEFDEMLRIPKACEDGIALQTAITNGWLGNGLTNFVDGRPAAVPTGITSVPTQLMASYDLEGQAVVTPANTAIESTCVPKPIDFFYNYDTQTHRSLDYYAQAQVPVVHRARGNLTAPPVKFNTTPATLIAATEVNVPLIELRVNKSGRAAGRLDASLTMAISGPNAETWSRFIATRLTNGSRQNQLGQLWMNELNLSGTIIAAAATSNGRYLTLDSFTAGAPGSSTGLFPVPDVNAKDAAGQVVVDPAGLVRLSPQTLKAAFKGAITENGATGSMSIAITNAVRNALFDPNGRYPLRPGETRNYVLQVCGVPKVFEEFEFYARNGANQIATGRKSVRVAPDGSDPNSVSIVNENDPLTMKSAANNCARSGVFSFRGENIVLPLPEVESGDGDLSEEASAENGDSNMSSAFDNDTNQTCVDDRCEKTVAQSLGGSSAPIQSTVLSIVNEESTDDDSNQFSTSFKLFGFDVLEAVENGQVGPVKTTLTIQPNYEAIAAAFGKPFPAFEIEAGNVAVGVSGLSVGFEYKIPLHFGPIQGDLIFGVGAGAGINVEVSHEFNPNVESSCAGILTDGGVVEDGCPDPMIALPAAPYRQSRDLCYFMGGTLVEPRDDTVATQMRQVIPASEEVWVGGQVGNEYQEKSDCLNAWSSVACSAGHKTYMRWLSDGTNFRQSESFGAFSSIGPPTTLGGNTITSETLSIAKPVDSAVTLQNNLLRARPMSANYRAVCKRPLLMSGTSHKVAITLNIGAGAGFSVGFCCPSDELGICLEGSVNVIDAKLQPEISITHTSVKTNGGAKGSSTKFEAKVGWSVSLLTGAVEVKAVSPLGSVSYTLFEYEGFKVGEGDLTKFEYAIEDNIR